MRSYPRPSSVCRVQETCQSGIGDPKLSNKGSLRVSVSAHNQLS